MCILLNVKKHEKTFALNIDIFICQEKVKKLLTGYDKYVNLNEMLKYRIQNNLKEKIKKLLTNT